MTKIPEQPHTCHSCAFIADKGFVFFKFFFQRGGNLPIAHPLREPLEVRLLVRGGSIVQKFSSYGREH